MHDIINNTPNICGNEEQRKKYTSSGKNVFSSISNININNVRSCFGIALHMHQPTIPAQGNDLRTAGLISNLQHMMENQGVGDNHNGPVFLQCYSRISDFIRELVKNRHNPRIMLDYSGNLLWGLHQMGEKNVLDNLALVTVDKKYQRYVEWLGTMWSHAVVSSTPVPDIKLHITAWQEHFASIFGYEALSRVKGFSPPEMHLPIHPDVCYEYIKALNDCGYRWLMVQEHTIENLDGSGIKRPHFPHVLVAKNSAGKTQKIIALIKTQGSDSKLVGQMQPPSEASGRTKEMYAGKNIPPYVLQIADGENGGVMMNEFPQAYKNTFNAITTEGVVAMNGSEYLEFMFDMGLEEEDFIKVQPVSQHKIWEFVDGKYSGSAVEEAIEKAKAKYHINLERASWTNDKNWVKGYEHIIDPINKLSAEFHKKFDKNTVDKTSQAYREALTFLLLSQTSCFRYWGSGLWTDYAAEICRRGMEALNPHTNFK